MATETRLVTIDNQLRLVLFGLECALDVEFSAATVEQIFSESKGGSSREKQYTLWAGPHLKVTGYVEDYEPGDIWLTVEGIKSFTPPLLIIIERAKFHTYRLERWQETY